MPIMRSVVGGLGGAKQKEIEKRKAHQKCQAKDDTFHGMMLELKKSTSVVVVHSSFLVAAYYI